LITFKFFQFIYNDTGNKYHTNEHTCFYIFQITYGGQINWNRNGGVDKGK